MSLKFHLSIPATFLRYSNPNELDHMCEVMLDEVMREVMLDEVMRDELMSDHVMRGHQLSDHVISGVSLDVLREQVNSKL